MKTLLEKWLDSTWYEDAVYLDSLIVFKWKTKKGLKVRGHPVLDEFGRGASGSLAASVLSVGVRAFSPVMNPYAGSDE